MVWFICIFAVWAVYSFLCFLCVRKSIKAGHLVFLVIFDFLVAIAAAYLAVAVDFKITWEYNKELAAFHIVTSADFMVNSVYLMLSLLKKKKWNEYNVKLKTGISLLLTALLSIYGTVNMETVLPNEHTYISDKLSENHTFAFVSDIHVGSAQPMKIIRKTFESIVSYSPEFIILGGDITDEYTTKNEMEEIYEMIGEIDIPVYFIYGNHDRQEGYDITGERTYTDEELIQALTVNGITVLIDEEALIGDDISLLGREELTSSDRKPFEKLLRRDEKRYLITADHQPYSTDDIIAGSADLQLSGHSHAGQYFQLEYLYKLAGYDAYGEYRYGDTTLLTSSGASGWLVPYRTARHCNFEIIHLVKE